MDTFMPVRFRTQVQLAPNNISGNIDDRIMEKIKGSLEGICSRFGYIRPDSIEIVRRSVGCLMKAHFNGYIKYDIVCKADICNPVRGMVFKVVVKNKNELGILAEGGIILDGNRLPVLDVLIPRRSAGITSDIDLDTVDVGDEIFVEVLGKRYSLNDKRISIIARAVKEPPKRRQKETERAAPEYEEAVYAGEVGDNDDNEEYSGGSDEEETDTDESESEGGSEDEAGENDDEEEDDSDGGGEEEEDDYSGGEDDVPEIGGTIDYDEF